MNPTTAAKPFLQGSSTSQNTALEALQTCLLPRVLSGQESMERSMSVLVACLKSDAREQLINSITTNNFNQRALPAIEMFLTSDNGLINELREQYPPNQEARFSPQHRALLAWALHQALTETPETPEQPDTLESPETAGTPGTPGTPEPETEEAPRTPHVLRDLWQELAGCSMLPQAMYEQLENLSGGAPNQTEGVGNPNLHIRIALARNPKVSEALLTKLSLPQEPREVRIAAMQNRSTPDIAVQKCLENDTDVSVLVEAAVRAFGCRTAQTPPSDGEIQLRARDIRGLNRQLDTFLITNQGPRRRLF